MNLSLFKKHFEYWSQKFGLTQYGLYFSKEKMEPISDVHRNERGKVATIRVSTERFDKEETRATAIHETCHLLLSRLIYLAINGRSEQDIVEEEENVVRKLEYVLKDFKYKI